jgi:hypothetical protein
MKGTMNKPQQTAKFPLTWDHCEQCDFTEANDTMHPLAMAIIDARREIAQRLDPDVCDRALRNGLLHPEVETDATVIGPWLFTHGPLLRDFLRVAKSHPALMRNLVQPRAGVDWVRYIVIDGGRLMMEFAPVGGHERTQGTQKGQIDQYDNMGDRV